MLKLLLPSFIGEQLQHRKASGLLEMQLSMSAETGGRRSQLGNRLSSLCHGKWWRGWGNLQGVSSKRPLLIWDAFMMSFHFPSDSHLLATPHWMAQDHQGRRWHPLLGWPWSSTPTGLVLFSLPDPAEYPARECLRGVPPTLSPWEATFLPSWLATLSSCYDGPRLRLQRSQDHICL